jgi:hypothetical protein
MSSVTCKPKNRIAKQFVVLDSSKSFHRRLGEQWSMQVSKMRELTEAIQHSSIKTVWIVTRSRWAELLSKAVSSNMLKEQKSMNFGDLLMLEPPARNEILPSLHSQFRRVVGEVREFRMLPLDQLAEVLSSKNRIDLFIGGIVDQQGGTITLARGDLTMLTVPLSVFATEGPCKPDFSHFEVDDYGYTLRFGEYEASAHSVLYKIDPAYRRRANQQRIVEERGFGSSLRRLRILRHLSRDDFPAISSKTIARIERGETEKPQGKTLEHLAKVLAVAPAEIETY